jgi:hypothetical protein
MKLRIFVLAAGSALAVAAPLASAATVKASPHSSAVAHRSVTKRVIYVAPFGPNPIITARYIYIPAAVPDPNAAPPVPDCTTNPDYCTDAADLCEYWGQC